MSELATAERTRPSIKTKPARPAAAYRIEELAETGPIGRTSIFEAIREGKLVARKAGRTTVILAQDWSDFLNNLPTAKVA